MVVVVVVVVMVVIVVNLFVVNFSFLVNILAFVSTIDGQGAVCMGTLVFRVGTSKNLSLTDSDESINYIGTPELNNHFCFLGTIFSGKKNTKKNFELSYLNWLKLLI